MRHEADHKREFYVAKGAKPNQFRPIFQKQDQILAGKVKDISSCTKQERPPRRSPPRKRSFGKKPGKKKKRKTEGKKPAVQKKEGAKVRNLKDATRLDHHLRTNHPIHTLKIGSLKANMTRTVGEEFTDKQVEAISARLRVACVILQRFRCYAYWICALEIDRILRQEGTPASRKADLDDILDGDSFAKTLATLILTGKFGPQSTYARALKKGEEVTKPHSLKAFELFLERSGLGPIKEMALNLEDIPGVDPSMFTLTRASELAMVQVQTSLRSHYRNAQFGVENNDTSMSAVEFFFTRNNIEKKYKDFPQAHYAPTFSFFSEHAMVDVLWTDETTREALRVVLNLDTTAPKADAEQAVLSHKGLLISRLFYDTKAKTRLSG
ncbi:hypothetical protein BGZ65_011467, partial [Modicella reniformis]